MADTTSPAFSLASCKPSPTTPKDWEWRYHTVEEARAHVLKTDIPASEDSACPICMEREITMQFGNCRHGVCGPCLEGMWWSLSVYGRQLPTWVTCHMCRAEVDHVGVLTRKKQVGGYGEEVEHGKEKFTVWKWQWLRRWMGKRRELVAVGLEISNMESIYQRLVEGGWI